MVSRYSKQREALIDILRSTDCHPTADWLYDELRKEFPKVSLATIYRNLKQLTESGEIITIDAGTGCEHYDACTKCHYHFVCRECGKVYDVPGDTIVDLEGQYSGETGFDIDGYSLIFYGKCKECKKII